MYTLTSGHDLLLLLESHVLAYSYSNQSRHTAGQVSYLRPENRTMREFSLISGILGMDPTFNQRKLNQWRRECSEVATESE